jgi:hypothetical protein
VLFGEEEKKERERREEGKRKGRKMWIFLKLENFQEKNKIQFTGLVQKFIFGKQRNRTNYN